ncbi:hypothetical protein F5Y12DRAFT_36001 [Xylaria sp. FL1777]|nr:hypothetical protein F5Y12DRAFT_36001 [Xylaria sp. FL1777]
MLAPGTVFLVFIICANNDSAALIPVRQSQVRPCCLAWMDVGLLTPSFLYPAISLQLLMYLTEDGLALENNSLSRWGGR